MPGLHISDFSRADQQLVVFCKCGLRKAGGERCSRRVMLAGQAEIVTIHWLRQFWFGPKYYNDNAVHKHYLTVSFAHKPNIDAQIWLTIFSPGIDLGIYGQVDCKPY